MPEVYHAGLVGDGGEILIDTCREAGVHTDFIQKLEGPCGHTIIQVDKNGQNCILLYGGSNQKMTKEYIDTVLGHFDKGDILLLQNEVNLVDYMIDQAYAKQMMIILNPSPYNSALDTCDYSKVSMFLMNEIEGAQVTGKQEPEEILQELRKRYPTVKTVLTLGGDGAVYQDGDSICRQAIFPVKAVDTTAAGDTFTGYFITSIIEKMEPSGGAETRGKSILNRGIQGGGSCLHPGTRRGGFIGGRGRIGGGRLSVTGLRRQPGKLSGPFWRRGGKVSRAAAGVPLQTGCVHQGAGKPATMEAT